ncbi:hypothetical protein [Micromonospora deserti]|uniref:hypothetical protein n=1 Tax=Micromonospora deserti TaxID=2070366 RepID=UPI000DAA33A7|nr:hypothetical protein [Micromonospora deserti]
MTAWWVLVGIVVLLVVGTFGYVGWRDRRRLSSPDDNAAAGQARVAQERHEAERYMTQSHVIQRGNNPS